MENKEIVLEENKEEKTTVSKNFLEMIIDKDLAEGLMTTFRQDFHRSQMAICTLDMQSLFY